MRLTTRLNPALETGAWLVALTLALFSATPATGQGQPGEVLGPRVVTVEYNVMVPMRDGVRLSTDIYRPDGSGPFPVVLTRNPYGNGDDFGIPEQGRFYASHGYVFLHQDVRGRFDSEGNWYPFVNEGNDGADACEWAASQPWSTGRVATRGVSYLAYDQWQLAAVGCEGLVTMMPSFSPMAMYRDIHPGGAFELTRIAWAVMMNGRSRQLFEYDWNENLLHLPILTMDERFGHISPWWRDLVRHPSYDGYWRPLDMSAHLPNLDVPVQAVGGWYDTFLGSTLAAYEGMTRPGAEHGTHQRMVIGPWIHGGSAQRQVGELDFGPDAVMRLDTLELSWADHWLESPDAEVANQAPIRLFVMGLNAWRDEWEWPLARTQYVSYYLQSDGSANTRSGDGILSLEAPGREQPADRFVYDPTNPVPTIGGSLPGANPDMRSGVFDQGAIEDREDVLVYTTPILNEDVEVTGPIEVILFASTSAVDTDFTAKLVDVHPDGRAMNVTDGIVRARYRNSVTTPDFVPAGEVVDYRIDLVATSIVFGQGHRIRVEISSSNYPRFTRNLNTGGEPWADAHPVTATQTVFHDRSRPSRIVLPLIPAN